MISREAKQELVDQVEAAARSEHGLEEGVVTGMFVIVELALPGTGAPKALYNLSSDATGTDLRSWDAAGMLTSSLKKVLDAGAQ